MIKSKISNVRSLCHTIMCHVLIINLQSKCCMLDDQNVECLVKYVIQC